jgi:hypothetical protein
MVVSRSRDGFNPKVFGPPFWFVMHLVAHNFPVLKGERPNLAASRRYIRFYRAVGNVLPCRSCRQHYKKHIKGKTCQTLDIENFADREKVVKWVHSLHNCVNRSLGKPLYPLDKSIGYYDSLRTRGVGSSVKVRLNLRARRSRNRKA